MKANEVKTALQKVIKVQRPVFVWGPPGIGKSSIINDVAKEEGKEMIDVRAVLLDPVDLRGIPSVKNGKATWCPPSFLPSDKTTDAILFLDELAQAPPLVQSACLQLCLDRRIGEYVLPDNVTIVAASNRQEDRAGAHKLITPLLNRFVHLDMEYDVDQWLEWAQDNIISEIRAFIRFRTGLLFKFDPNANDRSFPTPRSWHFVSSILEANGMNGQTFDLVKGCVGEGAASEFMSYTKYLKDMPDLNKVLKSPKKAPIPEEPAVMYAVCEGLVDRVKDHKKDIIEAISEYATRVGGEFGVVMMRGLLSSMRREMNRLQQAGEKNVDHLNAIGGNYPKLEEWIDKNRNLVIGE